jgi:tetratricopeptide (TPR) repeat protein
MFVFANCATTEPSPDDKKAGPVDDGTAMLADMRALRARVRHGEGPKVHAELKTALEQRPSDRKLILLKNVADASMAASSEEAWRAFKQDSSDHPNDIWPVLGMAFIYTDWKMFPQAQQTLEQADKLKPNYLPVELYRAQLALKKGDDAAAKAAFQGLLARVDLPEAHSGIGQLALKANDLETAKRELTLAVKGDPGDLDGQRALGKLLLAQKDTAGATAALHEVAAMDPNDGEARFSLAKLEESQGQFADAAKDLVAAGQLRGVDLELAQHAVAVAEKLNDDKAMNTALEQLARVDKNNAQPLIKLAALARARKDTTSEESYDQAALERDPNQSEARLDLARMYRDQGKKREAIEAYKALLSAPNAPAEAQAELQPLTEDLKLSTTPISGDVNKINARFGVDLTKFYKERLKTNPKLTGKLRLGVDVNEKGQVLSVNIVEDTLKDELLALHAYFTMKQVEFPKAKRNPVFEYELKP